MFKNLNFTEKGVGGDCVSVRAGRVGRRRLHEAGKDTRTAHSKHRHVALSGRGVLKRAQDPLCSITIPA